jgi:hypothetical protein
MCGVGSLTRVLLCNFLALGKCPAQDIRIMCLASGPNMGRVTACTALGEKLALVGTLVGHPIVISATALALAIAKESVDGLVWN